MCNVSPSLAWGSIQTFTTLTKGRRSLPRRHLEDKTTDVRAIRATVNMPLVTVFAVRTVRLDVRQAHGAAGAVRAFPMIEIRRHGDAHSLITLPPMVANAFRDASFRSIARGHSAYLCRGAHFEAFLMGWTEADPDNSAPADKGSRIQAPIVTRPRLSARRTCPLRKVP